MTHSYIVILRKNTLQILKIQKFNYKIKCIKDSSHRKILPSNVSSISIQHFKPSMP